MLQAEALLAFPDMVGGGRGGTESSNPLTMCLVTLASSAEKSTKITTIISEKEIDVDDKGGQKIQRVEELSTYGITAKMPKI